MRRISLLLLVGVALCVAVAAPVASAPIPDRLSRSNPDLFAYDRTAPLAVTATPLLSGDPATRIDLLEYTTFDGTRVPALFARSVSPKKETRPCIVLQHGLGGDKGGILATFPELVTMGYSVLAIDARNHGARGNPLAGGIAARDATQLEAMLRETVVDLRRGIDVLARRPECGRGRIGYVGYSMGGMIGALLAGVDRRVQASALVLTGGDWQVHFASGADVFLPGVLEDASRLANAHALLDPLDPVTWVGRVSPRPVLVVASQNDEILVPAMADALYGAARDPRTLVWVDGGHAVVGPEAAPVHLALAGWLYEHLAPAQQDVRRSRGS